MLLVRLGGLQTSFQALEEAISVTNRRVNALDCVVIPKMTNTVAYITSELDEREREDLFRLKKVIELKKRAQEEMDALMTEDDFDPFDVKNALDNYGDGG